jgi:hypothetical protein
VTEFAPGMGRSLGTAAIPSGYRGTYTVPARQQACVLLTRSSPRESVPFAMQQLPQHPRNLSVQDLSQDQGTTQDARRSSNRWGVS